MNSIVSTEFEKCEFGDSRLTQRIMKLADTIRNNPQTSINAACGSFDQSKAAYRLFENEKVTIDKIIEPHIEQTLKRTQNIKNYIILVQDTTTITCEYPSTKDMGVRVKNKGFKEGIKGVELHSSFALSPDGVPLGVLKQTFFTYDEIRKNRGQEESNIVDVNKVYSIEEKASKRWIEHLKTTNSLGEKQFIHVADRECDIYEFLQSAHDINAKYVIRSSSNRIIYEGKSRKKSQTIEDKLSKLAPLGNITIEIKNSHGVRENHICEIKNLSTCLFAPYRKPTARGESLENIPVNIVEAKEINPTSDKRLHWKILTNLTLENFEDVLKIINIYKMRWSIECFHRILKSGFNLEKSRLNCRDKVEKLATILSVVSWHLFWIYMFSRDNPTSQADDIFSKEEIKILKISAKKLKIKTQKKIDIYTAVLIIARLGGYLGRKHDGPPGMEVIWRGWKKLYERIEFMEELTYG